MPETKGEKHEDSLSGRSRWGPKRRLAWVLLALVMAQTVLLNMEHFDRNPFPPQSQHRAYMMVPRLVRHFQGYRGRPNVIEHLDPSGKGYALPYREPIPWMNPVALVDEFRPDGRLHKLVGKCTAGFYVCMPHSFSFVAMVGALFPGHLILANLGITMYLLLLIFSAYGIGVIVRGRWTGLAAAAISASYPGLFGYSRWIEGYLPATALSAGMVYFLLLSKGLTRWIPCLAFSFLAFMAIRNGEGMSEGIGAGLAVSGPFVLALCSGFYTSFRQRRLPWQTLVGVVLVIAPLALTMDYHWLFVGLRHVFTGFDEWYQNTQPADPNAGEVVRYAYAYGGYVVLIYTKYLKPLMTIWLLLALPFFLFFPVKRKLTLLTWFLVPLVACSSMARKALWYGLPIVPPLALITAAGLSAVPHRLIRQGLLILVAVTGLIQFASFSLPNAHAVLPLPLWFRSPPPPHGMQVRTSNLVGPVNQELMRLKERTESFLKFLNQSVPQTDRLKHVAVITNWGFDIYEGQVFTYMVNLSRPDIEAIPLAEPHLINDSPFSGLRPGFFAFYLRLDGGDFAPCTDAQGAAILTNPEDPRPPPPALSQFANQLLQTSRGTLPDFPKIHVLSHPDVAQVAVIKQPIERFPDPGIPEPPLLQRSP